MTKELAAELWPIIKAYSEGKQIQGKTSWGDWIDSTEWDFTDTNPRVYRIKPEPKLRPWKGPEDVVALGHIWLRHNEHQVKIYLTPVCAFNNGVVLWFNHDERTVVGYDDLLAHYKYSADGCKTWLPCGVEEDVC